MTRDQLLALWESIPEVTRQDGREWYPHASAEVERLAKQYGWSFYLVAPVVSILSPQTRWWKTLANVERMLKAANIGLEITDINMYRFNALKAWDVLYKRLEVGEAFRFDTKTFSFWQNLVGNYWEVTIDTWMIKALELGRVKGLTTAQYRRCADLIADAAVSIDEYPAAFQAGIWIHTRGKAD